MSEYQYYEFLAVDRPLDEGQLAYLRSLSSRARITPTSFVNTYQWGDFRGNPTELVKEHFDAFLYLANWKQRELMIRLPGELLDLETAQRYCEEESAQAWATDRHVILAFSSEEEADDYGHDDDSDWLASIIPVRADLAAGDLRLLYLGWLLNAQTGCLDGDTIEPPVPPDLGALRASLKSFVDFFHIDTDLLAVAAAASPASRQDRWSASDLARWIEELTPGEKDRLLFEAAIGEKPQLGPGLIARFRREARGEAESASGERTVAELLDAAAARRAARERHAAEKRARESARREREAALARERYLDSLAHRTEEIWRTVASHIDTRRPGEYDEAARLLRDLQEIAQRKGDVHAFEQRLQDLRLQHAKKPSLLERLDRSGLRPGTGAAAR